MKSEAFRVLILLICVSDTLAWIRFRQPPSRRNFVVQSLIETLQKCDTTKNTFCKICGEGNASTNDIPVSNYTVIDRNTRILEIDVGFQVGQDGYLEFRLCDVTDNATMDSIVCRDVRPLLIGDSERWYPNPDQSYAHSRLRFPAELECVRCVLQVKFTPGDQSMMRNLRFYDCSLLSISRPTMDISNVITTRNATTNTNINLIPGEVINDGSVSRQTTQTKTVTMELIITSSRDKTQPKRALSSDHAILDEEQMFSNNDVANGNKIPLPNHERRQFGHFGFNSGISTFPSRVTDQISNLRHSLTGTAVISGKEEPIVGRVSDEGIVQSVDTITGTLDNATNIATKGALNVSDQSNIDNTITNTQVQGTGLTGDANTGSRVVTNVDEMNILRSNVISNRDSAVSEDITNSRGADSVNVVNTIDRAVSIDSSQHRNVSGVQTDGTSSSFIEKEMTGVFDSGVDGALGTPVKDGLTTFREQSGRVLTFDRQRNDQPSSLSSGGVNISTNVVRTSNNNAVRLGTVGVINNDLTITKVNNGASRDTSVVASDQISRSGATHSQPTSLIHDNYTTQATRNIPSDFQTNNISTIQAVGETINNGATSISRTFIDTTWNGQKDTIGAGVRSVDENRMTKQLDVINTFEQNDINIGVSGNSQNRDNNSNMSTVRSNMNNNIGTRNPTDFNETMMYYDNVYYDYNGTSGSYNDDVYYNDTNTGVDNKSITQETLVDTNSTVTTAINIKTPATLIQASNNGVSQQNGISSMNSGVNTIEKNIRIMGVSGFAVDGVNENANQKRIGIIGNTNTGYTDEANRGNLVNTIGGTVVRDVNVSIVPSLNDLTVVDASNETYARVATNKELTNQVNARNSDTSGTLDTKQDFGKYVNQYEGSMVQGASVSKNNIAQIDTSKSIHVISSDNGPITLVPIDKVTSMDQITNNADISADTTLVSAIIEQSQADVSDRQQTLTQHNNIVAEVQIGSSSHDLNVDNNLNIDQNLDGAFPFDTDVNKYLGQTSVISTPIVNQRTNRTVVGILSDNQVQSKLRPINDVSIKNIVNSEMTNHRSSIQTGTVKQNNFGQNASNRKVNRLVPTVTEKVKEEPVSTDNSINVINDVSNRLSTAQPDSNTNINSIFEGHSFFTEGTSDVDRLGGVPIAISERGGSTVQNTGDNRLISGRTVNQDSKPTWSASKFDIGNALDTSPSLGIVVVDVNMGQSERHGTLARNTGQSSTDTISVKNSKQIMKSTDEFARPVDNSIKTTHTKPVEESIASEIGNKVVWQVMDVDANKQTQNDIAVNRQTVHDETTKRIAKDHLEMMVNGDAVLNNILPKRTIRTKAIQSLLSEPDVMPPIDFKVEDSRTTHSIRNNNNNINRIALPSLSRANKDGGSYIIDNLMYRTNDTNMKINGNGGISSGASQMSGSTLWDINRLENNRPDTGSDRRTQTTTTVLRKPSSSLNTLSSSVDRSTNIWNFKQTNDEQLPNYRTVVYDQPRVLVTDRRQNNANSTTNSQVLRTLEALVLELKAIGGEDDNSNGKTTTGRTNIVKSAGVTTQGASATTNRREKTRISGPIVSSNNAVGRVASRVTDGNVVQSSYPLFRVHETMLTLPRNLQGTVDMSRLGLSELRRGTNPRGANNHMFIDNTFAIHNRRLNAVSDQRELGVNDNNVLIAANDPNNRVRNVENERTSNIMTLNRDNNAVLNNLNAVRKQTDKRIGATTSRLVERKYNTKSVNDASDRSIQTTDITRLGLGVNDPFIPRASEGVFQSVINITRPRRNTTDLFSVLSNAFASVSAQNRQVGSGGTASVQNRQVGNGRTASAQHKQVGNGRAASPQNRQVGGGTANVHNRQVGSGGTAILQNRQEGRGGTAIVQNREVGSGGTASVQNREVGRGGTAIVQNRQVGNGRTASVQNRQVGNGGTASVQNRQVGSGGTASVQNRQIGNGGTAIVQNRQVGNGRTAIVQNRQVGNGGTAIVQNRQVGNGGTAIVQNRQVGNGGTASVQNRQIGNGGTASVQNRQIGNGGTAIVQNRQVGNGRTASVQNRQVGRGGTANIQEPPILTSVSLNKRGENEFHQSGSKRLNVQQNVIGIDAPVIKQVVVRSSPLTTNPWSGAIIDLTQHNDTFLPRGSTRFQNRISFQQGSDKEQVSLTPELRQFQISNQTQTANNVAIEGKSFIGHMRNNELGPIEPVYSEANMDANRAVAATRKVIILNATNEKTSTADVPRSVDRNNNIGQFNEIISSNSRISPSMDVKQAINTNQIMKSALNNFDGNNVVRTSGEKGVSNIGLESPSTKRVFFNQADLLNTFGISLKNGNGKQDTVATSESSMFVPGISNKTDSDTSSVSCPGSKLYVCEAVGENKHVPGMVWWCYSHCKNGDCPFDKCACRCVNANAVMKQEEGIVNETPASKNTIIKNKRLKTVVTLTLNGSKKTTIPLEKPEVRSTHTKVIMPLRERDQTGSNLIMNSGNNVALDSQLVSNVQVTSNNIVNTNNPIANGIATADVFATQVKEVLGSSGSDRTASESASIVVENVVNGVIMPRGSTIRSTNSGTQQVASESRINQGNNVVADTTNILSCKGINAFVNTPGIRDWCTAMCTDAVCPVDICSCS